MGKRGPIPKPTALKLLEGNPGKRPPSPREPKPKVAVPSCPEFLDVEAKREWRRVVPELVKLGLLSKVDRGMLVMYCQAWSEFVEATKTLKTEGRYVTYGANGNKKSHPAVAQQRSAWKSVQSFAREFGLSPSSRTRIETDEPVTEEAEFEQFLKKAR